MIKITVGVNDAEQRLDRFLRKYLKNAPLGNIYRIIRKDIKLNGSRAGVKNETVIKEGDEISLYISDADFASYTGSSAGTRSLAGGRRGAAHRNLHVIYEDENILAAEKPFGLLTHGDAREKKNTLVNRVIDYLIEKGEYVPRAERTFSPAAVNRLDRNTTGIVLFGKNAAALRTLNEMIRSKTCVSKYYLTVLAGELHEELRLTGGLVKDGARNIVSVSMAQGALPESMSASAGAGVKYIETIARPVTVSRGVTLAEIELVTGRTHQIRAHMAGAGYPVAGDPKYGDLAVNKEVARRFGLKAQLLHAHRLVIREAGGPLAYLKGKEFRAALPDMAAHVCREIFGDY